MKKQRVGLGQDSHRFLSEDTTKPCILAGCIFEDVPGFKANSDGDVVLHALCNAISSITGVLILGAVADDLLDKHGITDSSVYLAHALQSLTGRRMRIVHVALSLEGSRPRFFPRILEMRTKIASLLSIHIEDVGITATSGEALTDFGCGDGIQCFCILTTEEI